MKDSPDDWKGVEKCVSYKDSRACEQARNPIRKGCKRQNKLEKGLKRFI